MVASDITRGKKRANAEINNSKSTITVTGHNLKSVVPSYS